MNKGMEAKIRMAFNANFLPKGFILNDIRYRKDQNIYGESKELIKIGDEYFDCFISFKGKKFPVTIINDENIKEKIEKAIKENKIEL